MHYKEVHSQSPCGYNRYELIYVNLNNLIHPRLSIISKTNYTGSRTDFNSFDPFNAKII